MTEDKRIIKLISIEPEEHELMLSLAAKGDPSNPPFCIICNPSYNDYEIGDYVKVSGTASFWKVTGVRICFQFAANPKAEVQCWVTGEKMRRAQNLQREYSVITLEKSTYSAAVGELPDPGEC